MLMNDISRSKLVRYFCGSSDTNDTSKTANSSDAIKTNASVTRLSSYFILVSFVTKSYIPQQNGFTQSSKVRDCELGDSDLDIAIDASWSNLS